MVIWITGLSASGKTTLSKTFEKKYKKFIPNMVLLDGDIIRELFGGDLGFTINDRIIQIKRLQSLSQFLEKQSILVVVAALYSDNEILEQNRNKFKDYFQVYLKGDLSELKKREFKGLYKGAIEGKIKNVVGVDIKWNEPVNSDLIFDICNNLTSEKMAESIYKNIIQ
tara:strand:+ start:489 stop:992 length:504 start_codon:yes stop_codon:yes gene_type:complete